MDFRNKSGQILSILTPPHTDAFFMRCVAFHHDAPMHIRRRIATERMKNTTVWGGP